MSTRRHSGIRWNLVWQSSMLYDLAEILACDATSLPEAVLRETPVVLRRGVHENFLDRWPDCDPAALGRWLGLWCGSKPYLLALAHRSHRHDLDCNNVAPIEAWAKLHALTVLEQSAPAANGDLCVAHTIEGHA